MAKDRVEIPVEVTGEEKAQKDLNKVADAVQGVGHAGAGSAKGLGDAKEAASEASRAHQGAGRAAKELSRSQVEVNADAKALASSLLGEVNPQLNAMFQLVADGVEGFGKLNGQFLAIAGGGLALGGVVLAVQKIVESIREANAEVERLRKQAEEARRKFVGEQAAPVEAISDALRAEGALSQANIIEALELLQEARKRGVPTDEGAGLAGQAVAAGLGAEDVALAFASGGAPGSAEELAKLVDRIRSDEQTLSEVRRQANALLETRAGARAALDAAIFEDQLQRDPRFLERVLGTTLDAALFERAKDLGIGIKGISGIDKARQRLKELETLAQKVEEGRRRFDRVADLDASLKAELEHLRSLFAPFRSLGPVDADSDAPSFREREVGGQLGATPVAGGAGDTAGFSPRTRQVIHNTTVNIDTVYGDIDQLGRDLGSQNGILDF